jgi:hypothetical protein
MTKSRVDILGDAQVFYVSKGYGTLPVPLTPQTLAADKKFCDFHVKFERAFQYYEGNYPDSVIQGHLNGIDFNQPVEKVIIPSGQKQTQTQVAWGAKGNYYSTSEITPEGMGISPQGKAFDPNFVPDFLKTEHDAKINALREKMLTALGKSGVSFDQEFPELPQMKRTAPLILADKTCTTFEAKEDVVALKSTAKEILDTWSVPNKAIRCEGGGMQLYVSHAENKKMVQVNLGAHDKPEENTYPSMRN